MVDKTLILRKIAEIKEYLDQISEYSNITVDSYSNDWKTQRIVERTEQVNCTLIIRSHPECKLGIDP